MTSIPRTPSDATGFMHLCRRFEAPTFVLALLLYAAWAALLYWHAVLPGVLLFALGGYVAQLHWSLQHEAIHALRHVPKPLRWALVWPPLNLWLPFPLYHRSHSSHHVNYHLTHPQKDTESVYHTASAWHAYSPLQRAIFAADQTLAFRLTVGPWLRVCRMLRAELGKLVAGDFSNVGIWLVHAASVAPIIGYVTVVSNMSMAEYLFYFIYPGMMLGALRSFTEHRWYASPHERVAIVESNVLFGLLYLYNNLHHVHHRSPTMPWYQIPRHFRRNRADVLAANGNFYYRGYAQITRRYLLRPIFRPVHPHW